MSRDDDVFADALAIPEAERAAFLACACAADSAQRARVEALLRGHGRAPAYFDVASGASTPEEKPSDRIGRYKLLERIGEGGCGVVWMAEQSEPIRRRVALKVIKLGMDTKEVIARFEAERQALALMDHPNIAKIHDGGATEAGRPFFVMELVRGLPITRYCDDQKLTPTQRLELFIAVCHAVQHAHQKGIIHRDLKPSNILVTVNDGVATPKVIDFGIAKATQGPLTDHTLFTAFQQFIGTPAYMSPEQADLSSVDVDTRSDIYSLGVLLYELLAGQPPFDAKSLASAGLDEIRRQIRDVEPPKPSTRLSTLTEEGRATIAKQRGTVPAQLSLLLRGDLDWIVMRCLEKDRARRYETANALAMDLRRHLANEPVVARPPSAAYTLQKLIRRHRLAFGGAAAIAVVLVLAATVSTWQAIRAARAEQAAQRGEQEQSRLRAVESNLRQRAETQALAMRRLAYTSDMNLVQQSLAAGNLGRAREQLNRHRPKPGEIDLRGWEWRYLWQLCRNEAQSVLGNVPYHVTSVAVSADGNWIAAAEWIAGGLTLWNRTTHETIRVPAGSGSVRVAMSPTEPLLAVGVTLPGTPAVDNRVLLWNYESRKVVRELPTPGTSGLFFSADGTTLLTSGWGPANEVVLWRVADGSRIASCPAPNPAAQDRFWCVAATADLKLAAYGSADSNLHLLDLTTGERRWTVRGADERILGLAFSPDGKTLASGAGYEESAIRLWDVESGKERGRLEGHTGFITQLKFSADGKTLYSASGDHTLRVWDVGTGGVSRIFRGHEKGVWAFALLPDNRTLVSGASDGSVQLWDLRAPAFVTTVTIPDRAAAWRFIGDRELVMVSRNGRVSRRRGPQFEEVMPIMQVYPAPDGLSHVPVFAHDCTLMAQGAPLSPESPDAKIIIWDWARGTQVAEISTGQRQRLTAVKFTPQGKSILAIADIRSTPAPSLTEWDIASGQEIGSWPLPKSVGANTYTSSVGRRNFTFSRDARQAVILDSEDKHTHLDLTSRRQTPLGIDLKRTPALKGGAFSHNNRLFAAPSISGLLRVLDLTQPGFPEIAVLKESLHAFHGVTFSPDDQRLVTGGGGVTAIFFWDVNNFQPVLVLSGTGSAFWDPTFSPEGNTLGSTSGGGASGALTLWRAPSWAEIEKAEVLAAPKP